MMNAVKLSLSFIFTEVCNKNKTMLQNIIP